MMKDNYAEYIQDISFNDSSDRMVIVTTSKLVIIYKKVLKTSDRLIKLSPNKIKKKKSYINNKKHFLKKGGVINNNSDSEKNSDNDNDSIKEDLDSIFEKEKEDSNKSISSGNEINDIDNIDNIKLKKQRNTYYFSESKKNSIFNRKSYGFINKLNLDEVNELYQKNKEYEYHWESQLKLNIEGPVLRIQWANSEFGNLFACSGFNKWVYIFKEEKIDLNLVWNHTVIKRFSDSVMDISFLPKIYSLQLASVTLDGYLKISKPTNSWKDWETDYKLISKYGCTCLCCNPSDLDQLTIVIGCKKNKYELNNKENNNETNKNNININININKTYLMNDLIKIIWFIDNKECIIQGIKECGHKDDITDVDWANQNGRDYHMICSTSKDGKFIIWEINLSQEDNININNINNNDNNSIFFNYKTIFEFEHIKPLWRCCFNDSGIIASCIDEDGETFVFLKTGKNKFVKLDINKKEEEKIILYILHRLNYR